MRAAQTKSQKLFFIQVAFAIAYAVPAGGVFLSGLAMYLGAGDTLLSYLSVFPNICGLLALAFVLLLERVSSRKRTTILLSICAKLLTLSIAIIPMLCVPKYRLYVFVSLVAAAFTMQALTTISLNNWLAYITPGAVRGRYIAIRQRVYYIIGVVTTLSASRLLDAMGGRYEGYLILYGFSFVMALMEIITLLRIDDVCETAGGVVCHKMSDMFKIVLRNKEFMYYITYVFIFYLLLYISESFTSVFMLKYLKIPFGNISLLFLLISIPQIFLTEIWGKLSDKLGHHTMLIASVWFFIGPALFMSLTTPRIMYASIAIGFLISSAANAGFVITVFNTRFAMIPEEGRMLYDAFFTAVVGLALIIGPSIGGRLKLLLAENSMLDKMQFGDIRLLYTITMVGIIILQIIYILIRRRARKNEA